MSTVATGESPTTDPGVPRRAGGPLGSHWLAALLTAVVAGLAVVVGFKAYDATGAAQASSPEATQITGEDARAELLAAAAELSQRVLTYHHDSFEQDVADASSRLTPEFGEDYATAMERVRSTTAKNKISQEATAVASAIISATGDEGQVLVFVNQETSSARTKATQRVRNRLVVDLVRVDGEWTIAGVDALG